MASLRSGSDGGDAQQRLLSLIRNFATEKSQGERRVSHLKKRLLDLQAELEVVNAGRDAARQLREDAERSLRASEIELFMADASLLTLETRIRLLQGEVSSVAYDLDALKNEKGKLRDEFINEMRELNQKIRNFRETQVFSLKKKGHAVFQSDDLHCQDFKAGATIKDEKAISQDMLKDVEDKISETNVQLHILEQKYQEEVCAHNEMVQVLADVKKRSFLGESIIGETKQLQELARQTAESEKVYAALGVEIQKRFTCPSCHVNNMGSLEGTLLGGREG